MMIEVERAKSVFVSAAPKPSDYTYEVTTLADCDQATRSSAEDACHQVLHPTRVKRSKRQINFGVNPTDNSSRLFEISADSKTCQAAVGTKQGQSGGQIKYSAWAAPLDCRTYLDVFPSASFRHTQTIGKAWTWRSDDQKALNNCIFDVCFSDDPANAAEQLGVAQEVDEQEAASCVVGSCSCFKQQGTSCRDSGGTPRNSNFCTECTDSCCCETAGKRKWIPENLCLFVPTQ